MSWIIGILTFVLVIDCLFLILLILIQLPKKEAGLGTAFGGGTTDALFGAGTGNVLTKATKYCTIIFFALTLSLSMLNANQSRAKKSILEQNLKALGAQEVEEALAQPAPAPAAEPTAPVQPLTATLSNTVEAAPEAATPPAEAPATPETQPAPEEPK